MKQHRMNSLSPSSYTPGQDILQRTPTAITARRVTRVVSFVLGFALGTGVSLLLALLSAWLSPSTPAPATSVISNDQAQVWAPSHSKVEEPGISAVVIEEPFARL
jgi:hypothetical protein